MSYDPKSDFQDGGRRHLEFLKIQDGGRRHLEFLKIFGHVTTAFAICTKFHQNRTISHLHNGDLTIFKMTAVQHLGF